MRTLLATKTATEISRIYEHRQHNHHIRCYIHDSHWSRQTMTIHRCNLHMHDVTVSVEVVYE